MSVITRDQIAGRAQQRTEGGWFTQQGPPPASTPPAGNRIMPDGSSWMIGASAADSHQLTPAGTFDPATGQPRQAGTGPASAPPQQAPGGTAPAGQQDPIAYFQSLIGNLPPNSQSLISLEPQLKQAGITVMRNASGIAGKIQLPSGEIIDVGNAFSSGDPSQMKWQTLRNDERFNPGAGGGGAAGGSGFGVLSGGTMPLTSLAAGALEKSPGFQFRLQEGMKALEHSAAAKGTLLTGGTLKGLTRYAQDYASNEYGNQYARLFGEQGARYQQLYGLSGLGLTAAGQQAGVGSSYAGQLGNMANNQATQGTNLITGQGNVNAQSTIDQNNAAAQGRGSIGDAAYNAYLLWLKYGQGGGNTLPGQHLPNPTVP